MAKKYPSLSPYTYVANNPLNSIDPNGLWIKPVKGPIIKNGSFSKNNPNRIAGKHLGTDYGSKTGTEVSAIENGVVVVAGDVGKYGNVVYINHPNGMQSRVAHLQSVNVEVGQEVTEGDIVGTVGQTGNAEGQPEEKSHVHTEMREMHPTEKDPNAVRNENSTPIDADEYIETEEDIILIEEELEKK